MTSNYTHSATFASLKGIKEELTENYTTFQLLTTLDYFIENAIDPIISAHPDLTDVYFSKVIAYQFDNPNVKCSRNEKASLPQLLFNAVTTQGRRKREFQRKMLLNRGLLFGLVSVFLKTVNTYRKLHSPHVKLRRAQRLVLRQLAEERTGSSHIFPAILQVEFWIQHAYHFKELIVQKYTRLASNQARKTYMDVNCDKSLDDIIQVYMVFLAKAIDRCDSRQGVLTEYIKYWFYSAKSEIMKEVAKDGLNTSYDQLLESGIDSQSVDPDTQFEAAQHICATAKGLDPTGAYRFALHIPEHYSNADLRKLQLFTTTN